MTATRLRRFIQHGAEHLTTIGRSVPARLSGIALAGWILVTTGGGFPR